MEGAIGGQPSNSKNSLGNENVKGVGGTLSHYWVAWYKLAFGCWFVRPTVVHMKDVFGETNKLQASRQTPLVSALYCLSYSRWYRAARVIKDIHAKHRHRDRIKLSDTRLQSPDVLRRG
jgi:hypothetical protein